jgi:hypothetical protein
LADTAGNFQDKNCLSDSVIADTNYFRKNCHHCKHSHFSRNSKIRDTGYWADIEAIGVDRADNQVNTCFTNNFVDSPAADICPPGHWDILEHNQPSVSICPKLRLNKTLYY